MKAFAQLVVLFHVFWNAYVQADTIVETAIAAGFDTLVTAVSTADLVDPLNDPNSALTVFAPTDEAFDKLGDIAKFLLIDNSYTRGYLTNVLLYHVLPAEKFSTGLSSSEPTLLSGQSLSISGTTINGNSQITSVDIDVDGGVIHVIDSVLVPTGIPTDTIADIAVAGGFSDLVEALSTVGRVSMFSEPQDTVYTVFAPNNQAWANFFTRFDTSFAMIQSDRVLKKLFDKIVRQHFVAGKALDSSEVLAKNTLKMSIGRVTIGDLSFGSTLDAMGINGIVHEINEVTVLNICRTAFVRRLNQVRPKFRRNNQVEEEPEPSAQESEGSTIADLAIATPILSTLVAAVQAADLVGPLKDVDASLTVFAPDNDAFAKIADVVGYLLIDDDYSRELLTRVLLYHVVGSEQTSADITAAPQPYVLPTLLVKDGTPQTISIDNLVINGGSAINTSPGAFDIDASNGVVHLIDHVLIPPSFPANTIATTAVNAGLSSLVAVLDLLGVVPVFSTNQQTVFTVFAPTNEAFANLLSGLGVSLSDIEQNDELKSLLADVVSLHYVEGEVLKSDKVVRMRKINTAGGKIRAKKDVVKNLVTADVECINGVVHVIDEVIVTGRQKKAFKKALK